MPRYAIDFQGYIYVDSEDEDSARQMGSDILSAALFFQFQDGEWEILNVEEDADVSQ